MSARLPGAIRRAGLGRLYDGRAGYQALDAMERELATRVGDPCTIADVALYACTQVAGEGGFDLSRYPAIGA
jgi:glutathione S-transferase